MPWLLTDDEALLNVFSQRRHILELVLQVFDPLPATRNQRLNPLLKVLDLSFKERLIFLHHDFLQLVTLVIQILLLLKLSKVTLFLDMLL